MSTSYATAGGALTVVAALALAMAGPIAPALADHHPTPPAAAAAKPAAAKPTMGKAVKGKAVKGKAVKGKPVKVKVVPPKTLQVAQKFLAFNPTELKLAPGDTVEWTNRETDDTTHSVVQGNGSEIDSPDIEPGEHFVWKFDFPGEWDIICRFHPDMFLTINVIGKAVPGAKRPMGHSSAPPPPAKNSDPDGSTVPGVPGLPVAAHPLRRG
jgi:plastocyanin